MATLSELVGSETATQLRALYLAPPHGLGSKESVTAVRTLPIDDREKRTKVHQVFLSPSSSVLISNTSRKYGGYSTPSSRPPPTRLASSLSRLLVRPSRKAAGAADETNAAHNQTANISTLLFTARIEARWMQ